MKFAGLLKISMLDDAPYLSAVVFTKGCNMTCPYCHNKDLLKVEDYIDETRVLDHLKKRKGLLDSLVVSGGEPTLHPELPAFLSKVKDLGYEVKLDTNGTNPDMIKTLIDKKLVDRFSMDIKALPEDYPNICGLPYEAVTETERLIMEFGNYELRTTAYPGLDKIKLDHLCRRYYDANYVLQQYRPNSETAPIPHPNRMLENIGRRYGLDVRL